MPKGACGYISKTLSTSVLQPLCNTFNSRVLHCTLLARHNNIASKVPCSKTAAILVLHYRS